MKRRTGRPKKLTFSTSGARPAPQHRRLCAARRSTSTRAAGPAQALENRRYAHGRHQPPEHHLVHAAEHDVGHKPRDGYQRDIKRIERKQARHARAPPPANLPAAASTRRMKNNAPTSTTTTMNTVASSSESSGVTAQFKSRMSIKTSVSRPSVSRGLMAYDIVSAQRY